MDHPFRNSMVGGFNRQDVLTYLENANQERARQQQEMQQKLDEARNQLDRLEAELAECRSHMGRLTHENQELRARMEQANIDLSSSRTESSQNASALEAARRELEGWKAKAAAYEPDALAYAAVKDRTAGVELEAHRRAKAIEAHAGEQAQQLHLRMEHWLQKVSKEYDILRAEVASTVSHAAGQIAKAEQSLERVNTLLSTQSMELDSLAQAYAQTEPVLKCPNAARGGNK